MLKYLNPTLASNVLFSLESEATFYVSSSLQESSIGRYLLENRAEMKDECLMASYWGDARITGSPLCLNNQFLLVRRHSCQAYTNDIARLSGIQARCPCFINNPSMVQFKPNAQ